MWAGCEESTMAQNQADTGIRRTWLGSALVVLLLSYAGTVDGQPSPAGSRGFQREKGVEVLARSGIRQVVFATRLGDDDPHWDANIGYYCDDENQKAYAGNGKPDESG